MAIAFLTSRACVNSLLLSLRRMYLRMEPPRLLCARGRRCSHRSVKRLKRVFKFRERSSPDRQELKRGHPSRTAGLSLRFLSVFSPFRRAATDGFAYRTQPSRRRRRNFRG